MSASPWLTCTAQVYLGYTTRDKANKLRALMGVQGLSDWAYLTGTYIWQFTLYLVFLAVYMAVGYGFNLKIFTLNSFGVQVRYAPQSCWQSSLSCP